MEPATLIVPAIAGAGIALLAYLPQILDAWYRRTDQRARRQAASAGSNGGSPARTTESS